MLVLNFYLQQTNLNNGTNYRRAVATAAFRKGGTHFDYYIFAAAAGHWFFYMVAVLLYV
jgi:hypothetical protein